MNVFYEEDGAFKAAVVMTDNDTTLQVEAPHGKRSKIKATAVLLRFERPSAAVLIEEAQKAAAAIDVDFLWECCPAEAGEFMFDALARDYFGHVPNAAESAGLLFKLHSAPMYFYKKGKGRYKAAPEASLKAALAGMEKKRLQAEIKERYEQDLKAHQLPEQFKPLLNQLMYAPDKNSLDWKALEAVSIEMKLTPPRVLALSGALASPADYHLNKFLFEHFPAENSDADLPTISAPADLPLADVSAFSIDDAETTEIDDAFSVTTLPNGNTRVGIHIAAPALGIAMASPIDAYARARLSTVYFPGQKITMLPQQAIKAYTLAEGGARPALSLYAEVDSDNNIIATETKAERVPIAANLRHDELEPVFNAATLATGEVAHQYGAELKWLWDFALSLQAARGKTDPADQRAEYNFHVENGYVRIDQRQRNTPIDKVVAEMMIYANAHWGGVLAAAGYPGIYRAQGGGVARMTTQPAPHEGLGVAQYAWSSSPLRRYADLVNQRQLLALTNQQPAPYPAGDAALLAVLRDFEIAYDAYADFQRNMERYWCLRWIEQENVTEMSATVLRDNLVRFDRLPLVMRVASLPTLASGSQTMLKLSHIDLWELTVHAEYVATVDSVSPEQSAT